MKNVDLTCPYCSKETPLSAVIPLKAFNWHCGGCDKHFAFIVVGYDEAQCIFDFLDPSQIDAYAVSTYSNTGGKHYSPQALQQIEEIFKNAVL